MLERRKLIGGAVAAGVTGLVAADAPRAAAAQDDARIVSAVDSVRESIQRQITSADPGSSAAIVRVRQMQRVHLESTRQYPAFIEVGVGVWEQVYDWHVRYQQPLDARRLADGRYAVTFMFTTLLLRPDQDPGHVSDPYDVPPRA